MTYEYTRANSGVGRSAAKTTYTYDALNRLTKTTEGLGLITRTYQYDSLGNLTYETQGLTQKTDYKLNDLNQITTQSDNSWLLTSKEYTYDKRGNLVTETNVTNTLFSKVKTTEASYVYDETNKMVSGTNAKGEVSGYLYNGLNALVQTEWSLAENPKGYKNSLSLISKLLFPSNLKNPVVVVKDYVVDYTAETLSPLTETEVNGVSYRYVYGADEQPLSVTIYGVESSTAKCGSTLLSGTILGTGSKGNELHLYYHTDMRGTVEYMTSAMTGKIVAWADYNEWGEVNYSGALILGARQFDLVKRYATHDYDSTLGLYYAKARFYDPETRRFMAVDPILNPVEYAVSDYLLQPMQLVQYLYVLDNPLTHIDPSGELTIRYGSNTSIVSTLNYTYLDASKLTSTQYNTILGNELISLGVLAVALRGTSNSTTLTYNHSKIMFNNAIYYNGNYFVTVSCARNMLKKYGITVGTDEAAVPFIPSNYTKEKGITDANNWVRSSYVNGGRSVIGAYGRSFQVSNYLLSSHIVADLNAVQKHINTWSAKRNQLLNDAAVAGISIGIDYVWGELGGTEPGIGELFEFQYADEKLRDYQLKQKYYQAQQDLIRKDQKYEFMIYGNSMSDSTVESVYRSAAVAFANALEQDFAAIEPGWSELIYYPAFSKEYYDSYVARIAEIVALNRDWSTFVTAFKA